MKTTLLSLGTILIKEQVANTILDYNGEDTSITLERINIPRDISLGEIITIIDVINASKIKLDKFASEITATKIKLRRL